MTPQRFASGRFGGVARLPGHQVGRVISNLFGGGSARELLDSAPFCSELLYTAIPQRAASGTTATFTRATTATVQNNDGYLVTALAGEARFEGARRVRNLLATTSENLSNAAWTKGGTTLITTGVTDPLGTTRACTITGNGGDGLAYQAITPPAATGYVAVNSAYIRRRTGTGPVYLRSANNVNTDITSTLTTEWERFETAAAGPAAGSWYFVLAVAVAGDAIDVAFCQCEDVTAQTTQTAGEYVSVGVESAPYYHGSMVDGVKCFPTDLSGNPLTTMERYKPELAAVQLTKKSRSFSDAAWTDVSCGAVQNALGADGGAATGWTLTDNSGATTEAKYQQHTLTAATYTDSYLVKKTIGAQTSYPIVYAHNGTSMAMVTIDTSNGVATPWTVTTGYSTTTTTARCTSYNSDYWLVEMAFLANATGWYQIIAPAGTTNATQSTGTPDAAAQGSAVFFDAQRELGSKSTSRIDNTSAVAAATRDPDILDYSSGDIPNIVWLAAGVKRESGVSGVGVIAELHDGTQNEDLYAYFTSATNIGFIGRDGGSTVLQSASVLSATNTYTPGTRAMVSLATSALAAEKKASDQGSPVTLGVASAGKGTVTKLRVGAYSTGAFQLQGNVGPLYGWTRVPSQSESNAVSAP